VNPERIYRQYRDDALANQIDAFKYTTFVAMPFAEQFSYRSKDILQNVIQKAAQHANELKKARLSFADPKRIDDHAGTARVITEDIIIQILESHFFVADLTFANTGVLLETGIALGLKPNSQIILITQGQPSDLHFNIRTNNVIFYKDDTTISEISNALIAAAEHFEQDKSRYITEITKSLTPDAIFCLRHYGLIQQEDAANSLHDGLAISIFPDNAYVRFYAGTRDLLRRRLIWTDWRPKAINGKDAFGMHATKLGWAVIQLMWNEFKQPPAGSRED
jgi:hypothetical protein